jgi:hypothetical protein
VPAAAAAAATDGGNDPEQPGAAAATGGGNEREQLSAVAAAARGRLSRLPRRGTMIRLSSGGVSGCGIPPRTCLLTSSSA